MYSWKQKLMLDLKERFKNYETFKGLLFIPVGMVGVFISVYYVQYILQAMGIAYFGYVIMEGMRKVHVNRIKQALKRKELERKHQRVFDM